MSNKNNKRTLLMSAISIILCMTLLIGGTLAWFTDTASTGLNRIVSGNLDVKLSYWNGSEYVEVDKDTPVFDNDALWEPGYTQIVYLKVENLGSLNLKYNLGVNIVSNVPGINANGAKFYLTDHLVFGQIDGKNAAEGVFTREEAWDAVGSQLGLVNYAKSGVINAHGEAHYVALVVYMPTSVGNEANHNGTNIPEITLGIDLVATQMTGEKDFFDTNYDAGAAVYVANATEFEKAIEDAVDGAVIVTTQEIAEADLVFEDARSITITGAKISTLNYYVPNGDVHLYNAVTTLNALAAAPNSLYVYGQIKTANVTAGHVVVEETATIDSFEAKGADVSLTVEGIVKETTKTEAATGFAIETVNAGTVIENKTDVEIKENFDENMIENGDALKAALEAGEDYTLTKDVLLDEYVKITGNVKLNLNGHKLTANLSGAKDVVNGTTCSAFAVEKGASLTIEGEGDVHFIAYKTKDVVSALINNNAGTVTINGGNYTLTAGTYGEGYLIPCFVDTNSNVGNATTTINGGTFTFERNLFRNFANAASHNGYTTVATLNLNGGTFNGYADDFGGIWNQKPHAKAPEGAGVINVKSGTTFNYIDFSNDFETGITFDGVAAAYTISSLEELLAFANDVTVNGNSYAKKTVVLLCDVDLGNAEWTPIGTQAKAFKGVFDGMGHTVRNLKIGGYESNVGFFGFTTDGEIKNLTIENADVSGRLNVGAFAGTPYTSKYTNCTLKGDVKITGMSYVGGMLGKNAYADLTNLTVDVNEGSYVKANSVENGKAYRTYVGGVVGFMGEGSHKVTNVVSNIDVTGSTCDVGGITGIAHYGNSFINCSSSGIVTVENAEDTEVGGIAGVWNNGGSDVTLENCEFNGRLFAGDKEIEPALTGSAYSETGKGQLIIK